MSDSKKSTVGIFSFDTFIVYVVLVPAGLFVYARIAEELAPWWAGLVAWPVAWAIAVIFEKTSRHRPNKNGIVAEITQPRAQRRRQAQEKKRNKRL